MPLLNSAILNSNPKKPAFPHRGEAGLRQCKVGPESLPDLHFHKGTEAGDFPDPILGFQCMCMCLSNQGASGAPCAAFSCWAQHSLQEHVPLVPVELLTEAIVPGGGKLGGWSAAGPPVSLLPGPEIQFWFNGPGVLWLQGEVCCAGGMETPSQQEPEVV